MKRKTQLKERIEVAYFRHTGKNGGWEVFTSKVGKETQEDIARVFGVTYSTSHRWHQEYKQAV